MMKNWEVQQEWNKVYLKLIIHKMKRDFYKKDKVLWLFIWLEIIKD